MRLVYNRFEGMAPRVDPAGMARGLSPLAINAGFSRGVLSAVAIDFTPITADDLIGQTLGSFDRAKGLFYSHSANSWFIFSQRVSRGVDSLIAPQDIYDRVYFADPTGPRYMVSDQYEKDATNINRPSYELGIPFPELAPIATLESEDIPAGTEDIEVYRERVTYIFTLVDNFGHEGPPSLPSGPLEIPVEYPFVAKVTLGVGSIDTGGKAFGAGSLKRIYRATQGTESSAYQFVGEVAFSAASFTDTVEYSNEGEVIVSSNWYAPPAEIKDIDAVASNFLAGFYGNMLCFSDVKLPHAWPLRYRFPLKYQIVGLRSTANGLFVGTTGKPYWCYGADPEAAIPQELNENFPCVNAEGITDAGGFVVYPTHDGLVGADGQTVRLLTTELFDRADWQALDPYNMRVWEYEGKVVFYAPGTNQLFCMEPGNPRTLTLLDWDGDATVFASVSATARDTRHDRTVLAFDDYAAQPVLVECINSPVGHVTWQSWEEFVTPTAYYFLSAMATRYPVKVTLRSDRNPTTVITLADERPVRLPKMAKSRRWSTTLEFDSAQLADNIESVIIAQSTGELIHGA